MYDKCNQKQAKINGFALLLHKRIKSDSIGL